MKTTSPRDCAEQADLITFLQQEDAQAALISAANIYAKSVPDFLELNNAQVSL